MIRRAVDYLSQPKVFPKGLKRNDSMQRTASGRNPWLNPANEVKAHIAKAKQPSSVRKCRLLMFNHSPQKWQAIISEQRQTIGRAKDSAIFIGNEFPNVELHHACIWLDHEGIHLKDLKSEVGTTVNGLPLVGEQNAQLLPGDVVKLGDVLLFVSDDDQLAIEAIRNLGKQPSQFGSRKGSESIKRLKLLETLTKAEYRVLLWINRGVIDDAEIAELTHRSPHTVRTHVARLRMKLQVRSKLELQNYAKILA